MRHRNLDPLPIVLAMGGLLIPLVGCTSPSDQVRILPSTAGEVEVRILADSARGGEIALAGVSRNLAMADAEIGPGPESEIARLNDAANQGFYQVENFDLYKLLLLSLDYARATGGAFDPTAGPLVQLYRRPGNRVPSESEITIALDRVGWSRVTVAGEAQAVRFRAPSMQLDFSSIAPAYGLDMASRGLAGGARAGWLRRGGDLYAWGTPAGQSAWALAIRDPRNESQSLGTFALRHRGIAVVGFSPETLPDFYDPRTGRLPESDLALVMAIADTAADASAVAHALYSLGSRAGGDLLGRTRRVEAILLVSGNGEPYLLASASLEGSAVWDSALLKEVGGRVRYLLPPAEIQQ